MGQLCSASKTIDAHGLPRGNGDSIQKNKKTIKGKRTLQAGAPSKHAQVQKELRPFQDTDMETSPLNE